MVVQCSFRHKLRFTPEQEALAWQIAGCCRFIYNLGIEQRRLSYHVLRRGISFVSQANFLPELKNDEDFAWLKTAPSHTLQQALRDVDRAYGNWWAKRTGRPTFKKRGENDSFRFPDPAETQIGRHHPSRRNQVRLPKLGWVSLKNAYPRLQKRGLVFDGELKCVTVKREADGWWISFSCEVEIPDPEPATGPELALDLGVANSVATSEGELIGLPTITDREWEKLALLQREVARKEQQRKKREKKRRKEAKDQGLDPDELEPLSSKNLDRSKQRYALKRQRLARRKKDAIHKLTTLLTQAHPVIAIEDLKIKNMTRSAKGTVEQPGTKVAQKRGLNRAILDQSWGEIRRQLTYKAEWYGCHLVIVDPKNTSRTCPLCQHVSKENRKNQATFSCLNCGHEAHADINAAINILAKAREDITKKQSPAARTAAREPHKGSNACAHNPALKTPEPVRPSRKPKQQCEANPRLNPSRRKPRPSGRGSSSR